MERTFDFYKLLYFILISYMKKFINKYLSNNLPYFNKFYEFSFVKNTFQINNYLNKYLIKLSLF